MAKQDFEKFKKEIKAWLDTHQDEYDAFVADINSKSYQSIQRIYALGIKMTPKLMAKSRAEIHGDVVPEEKEFDSFIADDGLAAQLVDEFHNVESSSIVPCLLSWLYYGKCYETMVERLEADINDPNCGRAMKWIYKFLIKYVINGSIRNKMRTKEDWEQYRKEKALIDHGKFTDNVIEGINQDDSVPSPVPEESQISPLAKVQFEDYLLCQDKAGVLQSIKRILALKHSAPDLTYLYAALQELEYLDKCDATTFHKRLQVLVPTIDLKGTRNFQIALRKIFDKSGNLTLTSNIERKTIDNIKAMLQSTIQNEDSKPSPDAD